MNSVTLVMTSLTDAGTDFATTEVNISSIVDTWIMLRNVQGDDARLRTLSVVKARGMGHSNLSHEVVMSSKGIIIKHDARLAGAS